MTDREAMKMALEALERIGMKDWVERKEAAIEVLRKALAQPEQEQAERDEAILHLNIQGLKDSDDEGWREVARLRALLAQPEQEPVAWINKSGLVTRALYNADDSWSPLYTAPPSKPWVGLTDEEIFFTYEKCTWASGYISWNEFARATEAALRSKNNG